MVLTSVPVFVAVTVAEIVQVPNPATVMPENVTAFEPAVSEAGEGEPQPVYATVEL